jgi:hypothetical protein
MRESIVVVRNFLDLIAMVEIGCWGLCFWWMHRISSRQNAMLEQLKKQGDRIEGVSREEHKILQELHPAVPKIGKDLDEAIDETQNSKHKA